jgi:molybdenum cofactor cytidylyltransferase
MSRPFLTGLVLAAGSSRRLGRPKQLLPYQGTTLLGWAVGQAERSPDLDEVLVVVGHVAADILPGLALARARPVVAVGSAEGCSASYRAGLASADPAAAAVMILLGDQPGVGAAEIGQVAAVWRADGGEILVASYRDTLGHPLIFGRRLFPELVALRGDKAAWKLLDRYPDLLRRVALDRALPADVDSPADYAALAPDAGATEPPSGAPSPDDPGARR